jgi:2-oxoglutarate ferredoxin oxidoreductase subunit alpha
MAFEASRLSLEMMTPVILLSDGYIANGAEPWKIPDISQNYSKIKTKLIYETHGEMFQPYKRDERYVRSWAVPGTPGLEHRIGGLEKEDLTGNVSYDPLNHQKMVNLRAKKVEAAAEIIPPQEVVGEEQGDLLVVSWGGTFGATFMAVKRLQEEGKKVSLMHLKYLNPMPKNVQKILSGFPKILVCELNLGQMKDILNAKFHCNAVGYNKVQGLPFKIGELVEAINKELRSES